MALNNISGIICVNKAGETTTIPVAELISSFSAIQDPTALSSGSVPKISQGKFVASGIVELDGGQLQFKNYNNKGSFTGKAVGLIAFDSNGNIVTYPLSTTPISNNTAANTSNLSGTFNGTPFTVPYYNSAGDDLLASDMQVNNGNWYLGSGNPFFKFGIGFGSINIDQGNIGDGYRMNGKMVITIDRENNEVMIGNSVYNTTNIENIKTSKVIFSAVGGGSITDIAADTTGNFTLTKPAKNGTYALISDIGENAWLLTANTLTAKSFLGSLNNFDVGFKRNNEEYLTLNVDGITSLKDITSSGNLTLQKGNPRLRLRDSGSGGHSQGFDLHVNGDEFLIDDNTHSRNILRNYLNSSVHTTDFDAEVYNFKNGATTYATLNSTGLGIGASPWEELSLPFNSKLSFGSSEYPFSIWASPSGELPVYFDSGYNSSSASINFRMRTSGTTVNALTILGSGNVGIATVTPTEKLSVAGNINLTLGSNRYISIGSNTNYFYNLQSVGDDFQILEAGSIPRLTIKYPNGNVGIGTTSPESVFSIVGASVSEGTINGQQAIQSTAAYNNSPQSGIIFKNKFDSDGNVAYMGSIRVGKSDSTNGTYSGFMAFDVRSHGAVGFEAMRISNIGNIGIGTTNPQSRLDVRSAATDGFQVYDTSPIDANIGGGIYLGGNYTGATTTTWAAIRSGKDNATDGQFGGYMSFLTRAHGSPHAEAVRITSAGNVGIGTTPSDKLSVEGGNLGIKSGNYIRLYHSTNSNYSSIYSPSSGSFSVNTGGVNDALYVASLGNVGIGTTSINSSAKLEVTSTNQGVLLPRMTTTEINAISSPANGLMVYNTTLNKLCVYENTTWRQITTTAM